MNEEQAVNDYVKMMSNEKTRNEHLAICRVESYMENHPYESIPYETIKRVCNISDRLLCYALKELIEQKEVHEGCCNQFIWRA
jgi:hypothetical protein